MNIYQIIKLKLHVGETRRVKTGREVLHRAK